MLKGLKSARKRTTFSVFSGKRDELAKRACCAKRVHQYSLCVYAFSEELAKRAYRAKRVQLLRMNIHPLVEMSMAKRGRIAKPSRALSRAFLGQAQFMASRKRKSIGTRPTAQYDTQRFHSFKAWTRYIDNVLGRHILPERKVEIYHTELDEFKVELERLDNSIDLALVKEFYANLYISEGPSPKQVKVRGHVVKIDADSLNIFLETPVVLAEGETLPAYSKYCRLPTYIREIEAALCIADRGFVLNVEGHLGKILRKHLTTLAQVWSVLSYSNLAPTSHTSDLTVDRARLIFGLVSQMDMNVGALISGQITSMAQSNSSRLGFPALITALCKSRGVASDSLVFERLSPVINLAYIRKNCWNPDDLTVTIRGAKRARRRPAETPSTSTAPPPTCTLASPSAPAPADFQCFEAMLQSIHQGQIILLQSLQMVAPKVIKLESLRRFSKLAEDKWTRKLFNEWVAWPGTQSSLRREDEGPTAQVPQQMEDDSSETTTPEPLVDQTQEAAATSEKSLEATSKSSEPVADTASLQQATDPSTLEDQTTPVLSPNTSPTTTPVLHLIDKEDVQTQDTQDRSLDF
ncbi:hypothetical protein HKD37_03G006997 [Glycine soja]